MGVQNTPQDSTSAHIAEQPCQLHLQDLESFKLDETMSIERYCTKNKSLVEKIMDTISR